MEKLSNKIRIITNGFKPKQYTDKLLELIKDGLYISFRFLDNMMELDAYSGFDGEDVDGCACGGGRRTNYQFYTRNEGLDLGI
ncbi:MAG: hypothetical protein IPN93_08575 [Bacteroidetes bacterium]|nr:hypothetical protein [Bacteroidota bacterium]